MKLKTTALVLAAFFMISCDSSSPTSEEDGGTGGSGGGGGSSKSCVITGKVGSENCSTIGGSTAGYTQSDCSSLASAFSSQRSAYSGAGVTYTCKATWK